MLTPKSSKSPRIRLTAEQKKALQEYNFRLRIEAKTQEAYQACKRLGMGVAHGL